MSVPRGLIEALPSASPALNVLRFTECFDYWIRAEFESYVAAAEKELTAAGATGAGVLVPLTLSVHAACDASMGKEALLARRTG